MQVLVSVTTQHPTMGFAIRKWNSLSRPAMSLRQIREHCIDGIA